MLPCLLGGSAPDPYGRQLEQLQGQKADALQYAKADIIIG